MRLELEIIDEAVNLVKEHIANPDVIREQKRIINTQLLVLIDSAKFAKELADRRAKSDT
jgi:hypothetical protein